MEARNLIALNLGSIGVLLYMFYVLYRDYRIEVLRVSLTHVRNRFFDAAERGIIPMDSHAYAMTRQTLTGMIGIADQMSLASLIIFACTDKIRPSSGGANEYFSEYQSALEELTPRARTAVLVTMRNAHFRVIAHLLFTSLLTVVPAYAAKVAVHSRMQMRSVRTWLNKKIEPRTRTLDCQAYELGHC